MRTFLAWSPDLGSDEEDAKELQAYSAQDAATEWAQQEDCESADYLIVRGNDMTVMVKPIGSDEPPTKFTVRGESVAQYYAREIPGGSD